MNKQDIEKSMREVLRQKHIPGEDRLREIISEEIKKYYDKEEQEKREGVYSKIRKHISKREGTNIWWYILSFILLFIDVILFKFMIEFSDLIKVNFPHIRISVWVIFVLVFLILTLFVWVTTKVYDKIIYNDYKVAKVVFSMELIYWIRIAMPDAVEWIEKLF